MSWDLKNSSWKIVFSVWGQTGNRKKIIDDDGDHFYYHYKFLQFKNNFPETLPLSTKVCIWMSENTSNIQQSKNHEHNNNSRNQCA